MDSSALVILFVVVAAALILVAATGFRVVRPFEKGLVEFLGRYEKTVDSGLRWVMPFVKRLTKVDMREQVVDVPPQEVITKDNVVVTVDAVIYYEATDPVKLKYNVANFVLAVTKLAQTNLRNVVGDLDLDTALTSRDLINAKLRADPRRRHRQVGHQGGAGRDPADRTTRRRHRGHAPPDEGRTRPSGSGHRSRR